jgi:hypothetical protein
VKTRFQNLPFKCNLQRYTEDAAASGGPDAKVVAGYLLFLCARLISHRREVGGCTS